MCTTLLVDGGEEQLQAITSGWCELRLDLLLDKQALRQLAVTLIQPSMVQSNAELQRVPQVRILRHKELSKCSARLKSKSQPSKHLQHQKEFQEQQTHVLVFYTVTNRHTYKIPCWSKYRALVVQESESRRTQYTHVSARSPGNRALAHPHADEGVLQLGLGHVHELVGALVGRGEGQDV